MSVFKKLNIVVGFILISMGQAWSQDIHFSQFYMNPLQQNPAMAGAVYPMEANINYKDQWRSVGAPYKTFAMGYHMRFDMKRRSHGYFAAGVNFFSDQAGDSKMGTGKGILSLAYHLKLNEYNRLGAGVYGGFLQRKIDFTSLTWASQFDGQILDPSLQGGINGTASFNKFDVGGGMTWVYNNTGGDIKVTGNNDLNFNLGVGVFHLTRPEYSYLGTGERLPMRFVVHGGGVVALADSKWAVVPGFLYYKQGAAQEIFVGTLMRYMLSQNSKFTGFKNGAALYTGAYFRAKDAIVAKLIIEYAGWAFGISYDVNFSGLQVASTYRGGLELSLRFVAPNPFQTSRGSMNSRY
ncbi:MAG: PorP/SprF family type IX secretion system membrane protein [Crocinitomicaceae bacterium]|nr:PorP/SprF family type IX secretion system membrane protein [Crocinitomicaceae bacterium]